MEHKHVGFTMEGKDLERLEKACREVYRSKSSFVRLLVLKELQRLEEKGDRTWEKDYHR